MYSKDPKHKQKEHVEHVKTNLSLLYKIVILLVQEVSVSKLGLRLGGSEEKTQLVSYKSPED